MTIAQPDGQPRDGECHASGRAGQPPHIEKADQNAGPGDDRGLREERDQPDAIDGRRVGRQGFGFAVHAGCDIAFFGPRFAAQRRVASFMIEDPFVSMPKRQTLLVDLDGTLTNPAQGIVGSFRHALEAMGQVAPPAEGLTWIIGPSLRRSFADLIGGPEKVEAALGVYRDRYGTVGLFEAFVYDGVPEALDALKSSGARLILCTSKPRVYAIRILDRFGLAARFDAAYGAELDGRFDDKGDLIAHILAEERLAPEACAMWGDRKHDVIGAGRHAIPTIGALWGYGGEAELRAAGAAVLCARPEEVPAAFAQLS